ncbi:sterile alpha motif domain-containing protein 9-like [Sardina pilchardus]|uniref:sterile alpha motif domain-containing protein 9-like n=1 Tax=Sardina pilchardus TaxID=27697 RepID=UPI002E1659B0
MRVIHPSMAEYCLEELTATHGISKAEITNLLLTTDTFYDCLQGKDKLLQDVHTMLVKRCYSSESEETHFSPLIQAIIKETPGSEETVLYNAAKRYDKNAIIAQLLARYHYLKKKDFREAKDWARKAKELDRDSSYIADTSAQVIKHELRHAMGTNPDYPIKPDHLTDYLKMACCATDAFKETQAIAKKEVALRSQSKGDRSPYNIAGRLGEIQVAVMVMEVLEKIPVFSHAKLRRSILSQVLSGNIPIQTVASKDCVKHKHESYYHALLPFEPFLHNIKDNLRRQFDFLDNFFINLQPWFSRKDVKEERTRKELFRTFEKYADLFCRTDPQELMGKKTLPALFRIRQILEMNKADTHVGILECLTVNNTGPKVEMIVQQYRTMYTNKHVNLRDVVNYIYANLVLACVWPQSRFLVSYADILQMMREVLLQQVPQHTDSLGVHFIATVILWPENHPLFPAKLSERLRTCLSQLKNTFRNEMQSMEHGKRPVVHFYLGQKQGYDRLISHAVLDKLGSHEKFDNGQIWREERVRRILQRVNGVVQRNCILAHTCNPNVKVEVRPQYMSHLKGRECNPVSFYVGFTMKGPVAFDIQLVHCHVSGN